MRPSACELPAFLLRSISLRFSILAGMLPMRCRATRSLTSACFLVLALGAPTNAAEGTTVSPRLVTIQNAKVSLSAALAAVREQTGIEVADERKPKEDRELS